MDSAAGPITQTDNLTSSPEVDAAPGVAPETAASPPAPEQLPLDFEGLFAAYREAMKSWDELGTDYTNEAADAVMERVEPIREALFACEAPTPHALLQKLRVAKSRSFSREDEMALVMRDAERLLCPRPIAGLMTGVSASLCFAASDWSAALRAAEAANGDDAIDSAVDRASAHVPAIEAFRSTTVGDLALKMRVIFAEHLGARPAKHEGHWPEPVFEGHAVIPARALKGLFDDIDALAYRNASRDRSEVSEKIAILVDQQAGEIAVAHLYAETLLRAAEEIAEKKILAFTGDDYRLPEWVREYLREAGNDLTNLIELIRHQLSNGKTAVEVIEGAELVTRAGKAA